MRLFNELYKTIINETSVAPASDEDFNPSNGMSEEEVTGLIILIRKTLYERNRFFWYTLKDMPIKIVAPNSHIRTAAVDQFRNLYFNPLFVQQILEGFSGDMSEGTDPFTFLVAHEIYHVVNRTFERKHDRDIVLSDGSGQTFTLWNIATDFEMNDQLKWTWGISPPAIKGEEIGLLTTQDGYGQFMGKTYMIRGKSAERIYAEIARDLPEPDNDCSDGSCNNPPSTKIKIGDIVKLRGEDRFGEVVDIKKGEAVLKEISKEEAYKKVKEGGAGSGGGGIRK